MTPAEPTHILVLQTASPQHGNLDTAEEHRQILQAIRSAKFGEHLVFDLAPSARSEDVSDNLLRFAPIVLHFSGHCTPDGGLRFRTDDHSDAPIVNAGLVGLVGETAVVLAVLNGCSTSPVAKELANVTGCAIGFPGQVSDRAAIDFAREFYRAVAYARSVGAAFRISRAAMTTFGAADSELPELHVHPDIDADFLFLIPPELLVPLPRDSVKPNAIGFLARGQKARYIALVAGVFDSTDEARDTMAQDSRLNINHLLSSDSDDDSPGSSS